MFWGGPTLWMASFSASTQTSAYPLIVDTLNCAGEGICRTPGKGVSRSEGRALERMAFAA
jgi:hypothetical protein